MHKFKSILTACAACIPVCVAFCQDPQFSASIGESRTELPIFCLDSNCQMALISPSLAESVSIFHENSNLFRPAVDSGYKTLKGNFHSLGSSRPSFAPSASIDGIRSRFNINIVELIGRDALEGKILTFVNSKHQLFIGSAPIIEDIKFRLVLNPTDIGLVAERFLIDSHPQQPIIKLESNLDIGIPTKEFAKAKEIADIVRTIDTNTGDRLEMTKDVIFGETVVSNVLVHDSKSLYVIGWGFLQRFDFELDFRKYPVIMRFSDKVSDLDYTHLLSSHQTSMTEQGLKISKIQEASVWNRFLKADDTVLGTSTTDFSGVIRQTVHHRMIEELNNKGKLRVLRGGIEKDITLND